MDSFFKMTRAITAKCPDDASTFEDPLRGGDLTWLHTKLSGRKRRPNLLARVASRTPGSRSTSTARGTYLPAKGVRGVEVSHQNIQAARQEVVCVGVQQKPLKVATMRAVFPWVSYVEGMDNNKKSVRPFEPSAFGQRCPILLVELLAMWAQISYTVG